LPTSIDPILSSKPGPGGIDRQPFDA
jgi:hypothetical protein